MLWALQTRGGGRRWSKYVQYCETGQRRTRERGTEAALAGPASSNAIAACTSTLLSPNMPRTPVWLRMPPLQEGIRPRIVKTRSERGSCGGAGEGTCVTC